MTSTSPHSDPILELRGVSKVFGGNVALRDVDLALRPGEVHALMGENGAGKSTLTRVMCGVHQPSAGTVLVHGEPVHLTSPAQAQAFGVYIMHQEPTLFPDLDVAENVFLGRQPRRGRTPVIDRGRMRARAREILRELDPAIDVTALVRDLSVAQAQLVELAGLLVEQPKVLILDEPTASLTPAEVERMLAVVDTLRASGVALLFISHRLSEVFAVSDRITVLRDGAFVSSDETSAYTERRLIADMVGRELLSEHYVRTRGDGPPRDVVLSVRGLRVPTASGAVDLEVRAGEILGVAGLIGAGRTELARAVVGLDRRLGGTVEVAGTRVFSPQSALHAGLVYAPEDRQAEGVALAMPIAQNITLPQLHAYSTATVIDRRRERRLAEEWIESLRVKCQGPDQPPGQLSGGNQQKVVLAKWLATSPKVIILDEPTRGVDVGAKAEIHQLIERLANEGLAVLMISSDLNEVLAMSDRVVVMRAGVFTAEFDHREVDAEKVMAAAISEVAA